MRTLPNIDPDPRIKTKRGKLLDRILKQRAWIEWCESNGRSYEGENGSKIREADLSVLRSLETDLSRLGRREGS